MIKWRLVEIMDRHDISATALAQELKLSRNAVSSYRKSYPRITGEATDRLLNAINRLRQNNTPPIGIQDLIEYHEGE